MKHVLTLAGLAATATAAANFSSSCRVLPLDTDWPSTSAWNTLNTTVNGRLIATVPVGSPCHDPNYDEAACLLLQADWTLASTQYVETPAYIMKSVGYVLTNKIATTRLLR